MTDLTELADRIERAECGSRELDAEIALAVYGGEIIWRQANGTMESYPVRRAPSFNHVGGFANHPVERHSTSIDAALTLVPNEMRDEIEITTLYKVARAGINLNHSPEDGPYYGSNECNSIPLAICAAALRARSMDTKETDGE